MARKISQKKLDAMTKKLLGARKVIIDVMNECQELNPNFNKQWVEEGFRSCLSGSLVYLNDAVGWYRDNDGKAKYRGVSEADIVDSDE